MPIYMLCCQSYILDVTRFFSRAAIFKNSLIKLTSKIWLSSHKMTSTHLSSDKYPICKIYHWEKLPQKTVEILLNQAGNSFNGRKL